MKRKLYYVIQKELQDIGGCEEATGFKSISLYDVQNGEIVPFATINDVSNDDSTTDAIDDYLIDNGYGDEDIELKQL